MSTLLSTLATGWMLDRKDGVRLGFTSHDRPVRIDNLLFKPQPALSITSIHKSGSFEGGGVDVRGGFDSHALTEDDLLAGRWIGAYFKAFEFDWSLDQPQMRVLVRGKLGRIKLADGQFHAELIESRPEITQNPVPRTSPGCRAEFCGPECGLSRARYRLELLCNWDANGDCTVSDPAMLTGRQVSGGRLRWMSGPKTGLWQTIQRVVGDKLLLSHNALRHKTGVYRAEIWEACDHNLASCRTRYGNAVNFRGEPHLPGMDLLTRYPGA